MPLAEGDYSWSDAFLPVNLEDWPANQGTLQQQALQAVVNLYMHPRPGATGIGIFGLFVNLQYADRQDALGVADRLIASTDEKQHIVGLAAAIRLGSADALKLLSTEAEKLGPNPSFSLITSAIQLYYVPSGPSPLGPLEELIRLRSAAPGLDDAVAYALARVGTKAVLPLMAELLDSRDPQAQSRACFFFTRFAIFADKGGNISGDHAAGPFYSEAVRTHQPGRDPSKKPADYAAFWKAWWLEHRGQLGF